MLFFIVDFVQTRQPSPFAIITLFMFTTKFAAGVMGTHWPQHAKALSFATIFDEGAIALLFFVSLATRYPLVLIFLGEHALAAIPEKIRRSSHYLPAWKLVTLLWAVLYAIQTIVFAVLLYYEIAWRNVVEFIFGWPIVALFSGDERHAAALVLDETRQRNRTRDRNGITEQRDLSRCLRVIAKQETY